MTLHRLGNLPQKTLRGSLPVAGLALAALLSVCPRAVANPPGGPSTAGDTAVMVTVANLEQSLQEAVITYRVRVSDGDVRQDLKAVGRETGWAIERVRVQRAEDPLRPDLGNLYSAEFATADAFDTRSGKLPVEPLVLALRRYRHLMLVFDPGPSFHYTGRTAYHDRSVDIRMLGGAGGGPYRFLVDISNPTLSDLNITAPPAAATAAAAGTPRSVWLLRAAAALVLALLVGGVGYGVVFRLMLRGEGAGRS